MIPIKILAVVLLTTHAGSAVFIFNVLRKQALLLRMPIDSYLKHFRIILFALSLAIFAGNIIPIFIDGATLFVNLGRTPSVRPISVLYAISNALTAFISAYLIHMLYRLAANEKEVTDYTQQSLEDELKVSKSKKTPNQAQ